ncbi:MAG: anthranilate synthase component [Moraxellaceae bacterium]|jgi:anthranilate synthase component 1|nr:anthranilate synthase component [Moraxellaceae bacterium]
MSAEHFAALAAQGYNRVPVARVVLADLDTPLSVYLKLADAPFSYLFESVQGGERWGRYSMIGLPARTVLTVRGHTAVVTQDGSEIERHELADPLAFVEEFQQRYRVAPLSGLPKFTGGLAGFFGYDTVRYVERKLASCVKPDPIGAPDIQLMVSEDVVVFDNLKGELFLVTHVDPAHPEAAVQAEQRLDALVARLRASLDTRPMHESVKKTVRESDFVSSYGEQKFKASVDHIKGYVLAGDIMQVVPSQRMSAPFTASPMLLYRALRHLNPSPYMYYMRTDELTIVGSSPEILARMEDGLVSVRPIAGTRKRGSTPEKDVALEAELLADPKEIAEHLMLIDLGRNDVGRVSQTGQVRVTEKMVVERYSHVMHIVSNVEAQLKPEVTAMDVLRATLPAGTLSGAPKVRAMEIIDELEPVKRGIYGGAVGYLGWNGNMDTAIAIRTAVIKDGVMHVQAGAGVVADSVPELEWQETLNKARALMRAAEVATSHLVEE